MTDAMERMPELEEARLRFAQEWEEGRRPTLEQYLRRYPHLGGELVDFVAEFLQMEAGAVEAPAFAREDDLALARIFAALEPAPPTLAQAREAQGWTVGELARKLNLPDLVALRLEKGALREWPAYLEQKLSELFERPLEQVRRMLLSAAPARSAGAHYRAVGKPRQAAPQARTFREALEECARQGKLTEAQRREWLPEGGPEQP